MINDDFDFKNIIRENISEGSWSDYLKRRQVKKGARKKIPKGAVDAGHEAWENLKILINKEREIWEMMLEARRSIKGRYEKIRQAAEDGSLFEDDIMLSVLFAFHESTTSIIKQVKEKMKTERGKEKKQKAKSRKKQRAKIKNTHWAKEKEKKEKERRTSLLPKDDAPGEGDRDQ
jgi:polyribonucleotide nucleotidyltransferase